MMKLVMPEPLTTSPPVIHPLAVVHPDAQLAPGVQIGPFCHVGPKVIVGENTQLVSHVTIIGRTTLGKRNIIWPQATLGADPQDLKFHGEDSELIVGDDNQIHENATLHKGTENGGGVTRVGDCNLLMVGAHVAHDCILGNHIVMANAVLLAGHVVVGDHAIISGGAAAHHYVSIGRNSYIGGLTRIVHDVPPFLILEGNPADFRGLNNIGLHRRHFPQDTIDRLKETYRVLYPSKRAGGGKDSDSGEVRVVRAMSRKIDLLAERFADDPCVMEQLAFIREMGRGVYGRARENARQDDRRGKRS